VNRIKRTSISVLGFALVISLIPLTTHAQTATEQPVAENRCSIAKQKIATHAAAVTTAQTEHTAQYAAIKSKIDTLVSSATEAKYDAVDKLTIARDSVTKAISDYAYQAKIYNTSLVTAQSAVCGEGAGEFVSALATARIELASLRTNSTAVKAAVKENAVPALRDYAAWLKQNTVTTQGNE